MKEILVNDKMQNNYIYFLTEDMGSNFHIDFNPELDPKTLLQLGIFGGKYMNDCFNEFPNDSCHFISIQFYHWIGYFNFCSHIFKKFYLQMYKM